MKVVFKRVGYFVLVLSCLLAFRSFDRTGLTFPYNRQLVRALHHVSLFLIELNILIVFGKLALLSSNSNTLEWKCFHA